VKLVILITAEVEKGLDAAQAWQQAGAPGVTIIRTYGLFTLQGALERGEVELPRMIASMAGALAGIIDSVEERGALILSLVDENLVDALIREANNILGDLEKPYHGILFVVDVERAIGVRHHSNPS
jgi:nitrogen regulatory protein PII